jgi:tetratricopeptide (TPR) repeat protein
MNIMKPIAMLGVLVVLAGAAFFWETFRTAYEVVSVKLAPDAARALAYGQRHFDSSDLGAYSVPVADFFFWEAQRSDTDIPYVFHEIARVAFLRGELDKALIFIDMQIEKHGEKAPSSYYMRGLIQGYRGNYSEAVKDYEQYLALVPPNWAGINDYAWVLLKAGRTIDAARVIADGLLLFPDNPWLLNSYGIALHELGQFDAAYESQLRAGDAAERLRESDWLIAYPGNDPRVAAQGLATLKEAIRTNMHMSYTAGRTATVQ